MTLNAQDSERSAPRPSLRFRPIDNISTTGYTLQVINTITFLERKVTKEPDTNHINAKAFLSFSSKKMMRAVRSPTSAPQIIGFDKQEPQSRLFSHNQRKVMGRTRQHKGMACRVKLTLP